MKTVLITGTSRGIGKALAEKFLENGDFVFGTSTTGNSDFNHENLTTLQLDLSKPDTIDRFVTEIQKFDRPIDILINNAGIWGGIEGDPKLYNDVFRKVMEVNVFGTTNLTEQLLQIISHGGHIVNISSQRGSLTTDVYKERDSAKDASAAMYPDYRISKAALNMYTRVLAARLIGNVTISSVHPGWVKTDMGGEKADMGPAEAAEHIFNLANSQVETGQFWFKGEKFPW